MIKEKGKASLPGRTAEYMMACGRTGNNMAKANL
jgi:hypothetical protein